MTILCISAAAFAREGKVYLKNGRTLVGEIGEGLDGQVVVSMRAGSMHFKKSEIKKVEYFKKASAGKKKHPFFYALYNFPENLITNADNPKVYDDIINRSAERYKLSPALIKAVIKVESSFNPFGVSHKGAKGLMQLMPKTADGLGVGNIFNPIENINGGSKYLRYMLDTFNNDLKLALAAYNAGPNAVKRFGGIPPYKETQNYVRLVLKYFEQYEKDDSEFKAFVDEQGVLHMSNK